MAEPVTPPAGVIPNGSDPTPVIGAPPEPGVIPATPTTLSIDDAQKEIDRLKADLKKVHAESAGHRTKANELDKLKAELEAAKLSETEKLQKQLADVQAQLNDATTREQTTRINAAIQVQAQQQGIDARLALKLIERDRIVTGEDGQPSNLDTLFKEMVKEYPNLAGKAAVPNVGATSPARSQTSALPALSWEVVAELQKNPAEYNARNATGEISRWIQAHPFRYGQKN